MATIKEKIEKIMEYTDASAEKIFALNDYQFDAAYSIVVNIEESFKALKNFGLEPKRVEEDCGCGGCEIAIAECMEDDELPYVTAEELVEFINSVFEVFEAIESDEKDWE